MRVLSSWKQAWVGIDSGRDRVGCQVAKVPRSRACPHEGSGQGRQVYMAPSDAGPFCFGPRHFGRGRYGLLFLPCRQSVLPSALNARRGFLVQWGLLLSPLCHRILPFFDLVNCEGCRAYDIIG